MILHFEIGNDKVNPAKVNVQEVPNPKGTTKYIQLTDINQKLKVNAKFFGKRGFKTEDIITSAAHSINSDEPWSAAAIMFDPSKFDDDYDPNLRLKWANNSKNFSPMLIGTKVQEDEEVIIYITLPTTYKILGYYSPYSLLSTYFTKDVCNGCTIVAKRSQVESGDAVFTVMYFDKTDKLLKTATIQNVLAENFTNSVAISVMSGAKYKTYNEKNKKYKSSMRFKIRAATGDMITSAFITSSESHDELNEILSKKSNEKKCTPNPTIFVVTENDDDLDNALDFIANDGYKSVTLYNIRVPKDKLTERKIFSIFNYDKENDTVVAI